MKPLQPEAFYIHMPFLPQHVQTRYLAALQRDCNKFMYSNHAVSRVSSIFIDGHSLTYSHFRVKSLPLDILGILRIKALETAEISLVVTCPPSYQEATVWLEAGINRLNYVIRDGMKNIWAYFLCTMRKETALCARLSVDIALSDQWSFAELDHLMKSGVQHISLSFDEKIDDTTDSMRYVGIAGHLIKNGYEQYSTYDFALSGHRSMQQEIYASYKPYQGFGLGACSFDGVMHRRVTDDIDLYCNDFEIAERSVDIRQPSQTEQVQERIMVGLMGSGVNYNEMLVSAHEQHKLMQSIQQYIDAGFMTHMGEILALTLHGHVVENEVIRKILNYF